MCVSENRPFQVERQSWARYCNTEREGLAGSGLTGVGNRNGAADIRSRKAARPLSTRVGNLALFLRCPKAVKVCVLDGDAEWVT
jgi:hypothetical protein